MQLREFLEVMLRRKWMILFSILFILFVASVYCVVTPESYKSSTTILVIRQSVPENYVRPTVIAKIEDRLATIRQQVLSRTRLVAVMDELGLFREERKNQPLEGLVELMRKRITIEVKHNDAFTLSFVHNNPQVAMLTASRLASFFIDENLKTREQQAVGTAEFLDSQLKDTKKKLEEQEERVRRYKSAYMGELPQQLQANLQVMSRHQDHLKANAEAIRTAQNRKMFAESQIATLESQLAALEAQARAASANAETPAAGLVSTSDPAAPYLYELNSKRAQLANLSVKYTDRYPGIRRLKEDVTRLERLVIDARQYGSTLAQGAGESTAARRFPPTAKTSGSPPLFREVEEIRRLRTVLAGLDVEIQSLSKESGEIRNNIEAVQSKVERSPKREQEMIGLTRDYENLKRSYDEMLRKKLDADVAQNLEKRQKGEQFQILDPANLPEKPFVPNRPKVFGVALFVALLAGFGSAIGLEAIDPTVRGLTEFRHFCQIPVLSAVPTIQDKTFERKKTLRLTAIYGGIGSVAVAAIVFLTLYGDRIRMILHGGR